MQIKKQQALSVLKKLQFDIRTGGERFARFYHRGTLVLTTAVPHGKGDMYVSNQFRQQLKINQDQLREAIRCPFGHNEYLAHLEARGIIPPATPQPA